MGPGSQHAGCDVTGKRQDIANELARLEARLAALDAERAAIREQVTAARHHLAAADAVTISVPALQPSTNSVPTTRSAKVALFARVPELAGLSLRVWLVVLA